MTDSPRSVKPGNLLPLQPGDRVTDIDRGGAGTVLRAHVDAVEGYAYVQWDDGFVTYVCCGYLNRLEPVQPTGSGEGS